MARQLLAHWRDVPQKELEPMFQTAPILMFSMGSDGRIEQVSSFLVSTLGYAESELVGRPCSDFLSDECRRMVTEDILPRFFRTGALHNADYEFVRKGGEVLPVVLSMVARHDTPGNYTGALAVMFDNSSVRHTLALLHQAKRLESMGRLVSGVAHDFNNVLTVILGNLDFLRADMDHPYRSSYIRDAHRAALRGATLTRQLLGFSRRQGPKRGDVNLNHIVLEMDAMLRRMIPESIEFRTTTAENLRTTRIDAHQLETAIMNLVSNARDAMPAGGRIGFETANVTLTQDELTDREDDPAPGDYVCLTVSDTGTGMSPETLERIYEPFFSTKPIGKGAGLGMSMVNAFVRQAGGLMRIDSSEERGTRIRLIFPASAEDSVAPDDHREAPKNVAEPNATESVLVVEDDDDVRRVLSSQLRAQGYRVSAARNGDLAMELLDGGYRPQVLVTDLVMPGPLQGPDLAHHARQLTPGIGVIFLSGYPSGATVTTRDGDMPAADVELFKPVSGQVLLRAVGRLVKDVREKV